MRSLVLRLRIASLSRVAAVALIGSAAAGCSSDFSRFDAGLQSASVDQNGAAQNPYPGTDQTVTGAIGSNGAPVPVVDVSKDPVVAPDHAGYDPNLAQAQTIQTGRGRPTSRPTAASSAPNCRSSNNNRRARSRTRYAPVRRTRKRRRRIKSRPVEKAGRAPVARPITLREGETLYNLSRRYGVPVNALMQANDIRNADQVRSASRSSCRLTNTAPILASLLPITIRIPSMRVRVAVSPRTTRVRRPKKARSRPCAQSRSRK